MAGSLGGALTWEGRAHRGDAVFPIEVSAGRVEVQSNEQYALVLRDITGRRQAEREARQHQAELARFSRVSLAGEMAAGLAHELSQPLTAIAAYARGSLWLLDSPDPDAQALREGISELVGQADRATGVLDRLREFVRPRPSRREPVQVPEMVAEAISLARVETAQNGIDITARIEPNLPLVSADRIQIEQVLLNLLRNAGDAIVSAAARNRSVVVEARSTASTVQVWVSDTGPGVSEEIADRIFEPFVTTKPHGMGMGLAISRSILRWHGGALRLVQEPGCGATFVLELPIRAEASGHAGE